MVLQVFRRMSAQATRALSFFQSRAPLSALLQGGEGSGGPEPMETGRALWAFVGLRVSALNRNRVVSVDVSSLR